MMMLSNSLHWPNKIGAHRKAAHPSPMGRRHWSAQRCAKQQKVSCKKCEVPGPAGRVYRCAPAKSRTVVRRVTDLPTVLRCIIFLFRAPHAP